MRQEEESIAALLLAIQEDHADSQQCWEELRRRGWSDYDIATTHVREY